MNPPPPPTPQKKKYLQVANTKKKKKSHHFSQNPKSVKFKILHPLPRPQHTQIVLAYAAGRIQSTPHLPWGKEGGQLMK